MYAGTYFVVCLAEGRAFPCRAQYGHSARETPILSAFTRGILVFPEMPPCSMLSCAAVFVGLSACGSRVNLCFFDGASKFFFFFFLKTNPSRIFNEKGITI